MTLASLLGATLVLSALGTGWLRRYALARRVLDVPNARSSHTVPTPRGGGVAIVAAFLLGLAALALDGRVAAFTAVGLGGAGVLVALVGFIDDHRPLSARARLVAHFVGAAWLVGWVGGLPPLPLFGTTLRAGIVGDAVAVVALVWLLNLYNFMDGIDGIAGVEALTAAFGAVLASLSHPSPRPDWALPALLAAAATGFLLWNFPPARIFMGDAGSGFLGLSLGGVALATAANAPALVWSWAILLAVFVTDATVTLITRVRRGERASEAHRSHAYQIAARRLGSHRPVTLAVAAINIGWLLPWAAAVAAGRIDPGLALPCAYAPLVWGALRLGAGAPEPAPGTSAR